jgi:hypothetical protein
MKFAGATKFHRKSGEGGDLKVRPVQISENASLLEQLFS